MHDLDNHYAMSHPNTIPALCHRCPKICHDKAELISHIESHQNEGRVTTDGSLASICHLCGEFYQEGNDFNSHMAVCEGAKSPIGTTGFNHVESFPIPPQTHTTPPNTTGQSVLGSMDINCVQTSYDLLKRVVTNTIYSNTSTNSNQIIDRDYWEGENMEVMMNEGRTASRSWETCQDLQTPCNQDEYQDPADTNEEQPLIIDLEDNTGLLTEDSEVIELRKKVVAELSIEEMNIYKCKAYDYE